MQPHISVMKQEVLDAFDGLKMKIFIDGTLGAGGHTAAMLRAHPELEAAYGFDQDATALLLATQRVNDPKLSTVHANFRLIKDKTTDLGVRGADGILLDLGISSMQIDEPSRGFSFMRAGPLDMRMDATQPLTAADIVNQWPMKELECLFKEYGEETQWRKAAYLVNKARLSTPILTTDALAKVLEPLKYGKRSTKNHPATLVFQALRIYVNQELQALEIVLPQAITLLKKGGRLAIITFHSLEDRIVKNHFKDAASDKVGDGGGLGAGLFISKEPVVKVVTRKAMQPSAGEVEANPRSRSAKLRVVEKL